MGVVSVNHPQVLEYVKNTSNRILVPSFEVCFALHDGSRDQEPLSEPRCVVTLENHRRKTMELHVCDVARPRLNRFLMWAIAHYAFEQAKVHTVLAVIPGDFSRLEWIVSRLGFQYEFTIPDFFDYNIEASFYTIQRNTCWLLNLWKPYQLRQTKTTDGALILDDAGTDELFPTNPHE